MSTAPAALRNTAPLFSNRLRPLLLPIRLLPDALLWISVALSRVTELLPACSSSPDTVSVPPGTSAPLSSALPPLMVPALHSNRPPMRAAICGAISSVPADWVKRLAISLLLPSTSVPPPRRNCPLPSMRRSAASVVVPPLTCSVAPSSTCCVPASSTALFSVAVPSLTTKLPSWSKATLPKLPKSTVPAPLLVSVPLFSKRPPSGPVS